MGKLVFGRLMVDFWSGATGDEFSQILYFFHYREQSTQRLLRAGPSPGQGRQRRPRRFPPTLNRSFFFTSRASNICIPFRKLARECTIFAGVTFPLAKHLSLW